MREDAHCDGFGEGDLPNRPPDLLSQSPRSARPDDDASAASEVHATAESNRVADDAVEDVGDQRAGEGQSRVRDG